MSVNEFRLPTPLAQSVLGVIQERIVQPNDEFVVADTCGRLAHDGTKVAVDAKLYEQLVEKAAR